MSDPRAQVTGLITAAWSTQAIGVAARLKLFDLLAAGPRPSSELATETGSHPGALFRLMRALASLDLLRHLGGDRFELTEAGQLLRSDTPGSIRGMALHWGQRLWGALSQLDESVRTGKAWRVSGAEGFEEMSRDPAQLAMFHRSMTDQTRGVAKAILQACDFSRFRTVVDVGGSQGALLAAILQAHPGLTGQSFDLPGLEGDAKAYLEEAGVSDRGRFTGGSFFEALPPGADAYLLKMIIHDWYDEEAVRILDNTRQAAGKTGVVLVMERIVPALATTAPADHVTLRGDILMLTAAGGMERTEAEYHDLFGRAGLAIRSISPTASGFSVIEASAA